MRRKRILCHEVEAAPRWAPLSRRAAGRISWNLFLAFGLFAGLAACTALIQPPLGWGRPGLDTAILYAASSSLFVSWILAPVTLVYDLSLHAIPDHWTSRTRRTAAIVMALATSAALYLAVLTALAMGPPYPGTPPPRPTGNELLDLVPLVLFPLAYGALVRLPRSWIRHGEGASPTRFLAERR